MVFNEEEIKKIKSMYITARQFKNVKENNELVPTSKNNFRNNIFPFVVNKSSACEIYLKLILIITKKKQVKIHNLEELSKRTHMDVKLKKYLSLNKSELTEQQVEEYLINISNAFEDWRYIYEKRDIKVMYGFLNMYCNFLDGYCKELMRSLFDIDVDKELIYIYNVWYNLSNKY